MTLEGVIGLSLGGVDIQRPDLDVFLAIDEGLDGLPAVRGGSDLIPFRHGRLATPRYADHRRPVLNGWVTGKATATMRAEFRAYVDSLKAVLDPTKQETILLVATLEDASTRWLNVRVADLLWGETIASGARRVSVELEALDPFWLGAYGSLAMDTGVLLDTGYLMDESHEIVVAPTSSYYDVVIDVPGTADVERVRVRLLGPSVGVVGAVNLAITGLGFIAPPLAGATGAVPAEQVIVDNYARTATDENGASVRGTLDLDVANQHGEYLRLIPGLNTVRIIGQPAEARISFTPTYL